MTGDDKELADGKGKMLTFECEDRVEWAFDKFSKGSPLEPVIKVQLFGTPLPLSADWLINVRCFEN